MRLFHNQHRERDLIINMHITETEMKLCIHDTSDEKTGRKNRQRLEKNQAPKSKNFFDNTCT